METKKEREKERREGGTIKKEKGKGERKKMLTKIVRKKNVVYIYIQ